MRKIEIKLKNGDTISVLHENEIELEAAITADFFEGNNLDIKTPLISPGMKIFSSVTTTQEIDAARINFDEIETVEFSQA